MNDYLVYCFKLMQNEANTTRKESAIVKQDERVAARKRRTTFMIDEADMAELELIAQAQRVSLAWVIRDAIKQYLGNRTPRFRPPSSQPNRRA